MAKKITIKKIIKATNENYAEPIAITYGEGESAIEIPVRRYLSLGERVMFVNTVVDSVFMVSESGEEMYVPALEGFALAYAMVSFFTPIDISEDGEEAWDFIARTGICKRIEHIAKEEVESLTEVVYNAIKFRKEKILKRNKLDDVLDSIASVAAAVKEKTDDMDMSQILDYLDKANPELRNQLEEFVKSQISDESPTE